ncbi:MAG: NAD-dependent epimerase/dehydratase family protein [Acidimicrobiales bacterium]
MRVVVVGATGNVGSSTLRALSLDPTIRHLVGVARRVPQGDRSGVEWRAADLAVDDLAPIALGADAVVDLAWALKPAKDARRLHATNIVGSVRLFGAVAAGGVQTLVYASSVGAYSPAPGGQPVTEEHPTHGVGGSRYAEQKAYVGAGARPVRARTPRGAGGAVADRTVLQGRGRRRAVPDLPRRARPALAAPRPPRAGGPRGPGAGRPGGPHRRRRPGPRRPPGQGPAGCGPHPHAPDTPPGNLLVGPAAALIDRVRDAFRSLTNESAEARR